jgi:hypothetical protein
VFGSEAVITIARVTGNIVFLAGRESLELFALPKLMFFLANWTKFGVFSPL